MSKYKSNLHKQMRKKEALLAELYKQRENPDVFRENFWNIQSGINSLSVDIYTLRSRLEHLEAPQPNLPDHELVETINKHI